MKNPMKRVLCVICCVLTDQSLQAQTAPGILIEDPAAVAKDNSVNAPPPSDKTYPLIERQPSGARPDARPIEEPTGGDRDGYDREANSRLKQEGGSPSATILFDESSLNSAMAMAAYDGGRSGNPLTLIVQLQTVPTRAEALEMEQSGKTLQDLRQANLEERFSRPGRPRTIYNPKYPKLGEVLSIPVSPEEIPDWIRRISRELPEARRVFAEQSAMAQQRDPDHSRSPQTDVNLMQIVTVPRLSVDPEAVAEQMISKPGRNMCQLLVPSTSEWIDLARHTESSVTEGTQQAPPIGTRSPRDQPGSDRPKRDDAGGSDHWFIGATREHSAEEIEATVRRLGGKVSDLSIRKVEFLGDDALVGALRKEGLRPLRVR